MTAGRFDMSAPDALLLVEAFCNTLDRRSFRTHGSVHEPHDDLADAAALGAWLRRNRLLRRGATAATRRDLQLAKRLRAVLRDTIEHHDTSPARRSTDRVLRDFPLHPVVSPTGVELRPAHGGVRGALAALAGMAAQATVDGSWQRLRMCAALDCRWVYVDRSRNRTARWCSMSTCGNREKTRRYRHRPGTRQARDRGQPNR